MHVNWHIEITLSLVCNYNIAVPDIRSWHTDCSVAAINKVNMFYRGIRAFQQARPLHTKGDSKVNTEELGTLAIPTE